MVILEHYDFENCGWVRCGAHVTETVAWKSITGSDEDYRTLNDLGEVLTDKSRCEVSDEGVEDGAFEEVSCDCLVAGDCEECTVAEVKSESVEVEEEEVNPLDYVSTPAPDHCTLKISPSSFGKFIEKPWVWFRQVVQGIDKFEYSTSSVIGTVVHYVAECVGSDQEVNKKHIENYIEKHEENDNYCKATVRLQWLPMATVLVNDYVLPNKDNFLATELPIFAELVKGIFPAGTLDLLEGTKEDCMLTDYKTYHSKTKPKAISSLYRYQLCVYVWILRKLGYNVSRIRLVFINRNIDGGVSEKTGKALKSYAPEVTVLTESVNPDDMIFVEGQLKLCAETLEASGKYPELRHIIWHDWRAEVNYKEPIKLKLGETYHN